ALIGMPTGEASGLDVLDVDPRHGGDVWHAANMHRLPETRLHRTQSGGLHLLFIHAPGVRNSESKIAPGIDVRGDGGYAIIPPSPGYVVEHDAPPAHWPDWLLIEALPPPPPPRAPSGPHPRPVALDVNRHARALIT
ncbi:bifunctional DNA primase/polymerase, partial [Acidisphaera rubrifaciens]|uniref:bifunctional DNA primase/polymerase n=1 Tax=Acidisphaera rubrifaciens TaxID=50715 RepID=UPI0011DD7530